MMMNQSRANFNVPRRSGGMPEAPAARQPDRAPERAKSLAMVYPVVQNFGEVYEPADALNAGTLFKQLELPFHKGFRL